MNSTFSWRSYFGYGLGDFGFNALFQFSQIYLLIFFTDVMGISPAKATSIFLIARLWDAVNDPIMGWVAERTRTRWGRYRPWLLFGSVPLALSLVLLFWAPAFQSESLRYAYALGTYLFFGMAFTATNIPYGALTAALSQDYTVRARLTGWRMTLGIVGGMVAAGSANAIVQHFGDGADPTTGYRVAAAVFAAMAAVTLLVCFGTVRERVAAATEFISLRKAFPALLKNRPFWLLTLGFVFNFATLTLISAMIPYFFEFHLGDAPAQQLGLLLIFATAAVSVPFWAWVGETWGKKQSYLLGGICYLAALIGLYFLPTDNLLPFYGLFVLLGVGAGASAFAGWAMLPDTVEYGQWKTGQRSEGIIYGVYGFFFKLGVMLGLVTASQGLAWSGYLANQPQSVPALTAIHALPTLGAAVFLALSMVLIAGYRLGKDRHVAMVAEVE